MPRTSMARASISTTTSWPRCLRSARSSPTMPRSPRPAATGGRWRCTGRSTARSHNWPTWWCGRRPPSRWPAWFGRATSRGFRSRSPAGGAGCAGRRFRPWRRRARHHRTAGHRGDRRRLRDRGGDGRDVRPRPRTRAPSRPRPDGRPLPAELRPRHCRRMGRVPRRRAVLHALRQDRIDGASGSRSCSPTARSSSPAARRPAPWGPTSPSSSSAAKARSASITKVWLRTHPLPAHEATRGVHVPDVPRRDRGVPSDAPTRRHAGRASPVRRRGVARGHGGDGTKCALLVLDEGDRRLVEATMAIVEESCARRAVTGRRVAGRRVAGPPQRHQRAAGADPQGLRRRHDGDRRAVVALARLFDEVRRGAAGRADGPRRHLPPLAQLPRRGVPLLHVRRHSAGRTRSRRRTSRCGMPASERCWPPAATCRTTTASASTAPGSWPRRSAPATACCSR